MRTREICTLVFGQIGAAWCPFTGYARDLFCRALAQLCDCRTNPNIVPGADEYRRGGLDVPKSIDWESWSDGIFYLRRYLSQFGGQQLADCINQIGPGTLPEPAFTLGELTERGTIEALKAAGIWDIAREGDTTGEMVRVLLLAKFWTAFWNDRLPTTDIELAAELAEFHREVMPRYRVLKGATGDQTTLWLLPVEQAKAKPRKRARR